MSNSLRKGLIATLTAFLAVVLAFVVLTNVNFAKAETIAIPDDANAPRVTGEWTDDFYVKDGASVRLETEGIKFTTIVTKAYMQELTKDNATVEFFATAKRVGGNAQAMPYKYQPDVATMGETCNLNTYLNFNKYTGDMATACATDFVIETYAKITDTNGGVTYVRAYKPEGNDIARCMRAVANMASIGGMEGLETYYGSREDIHKGYGVFVADTAIDNVNNIEVSAFKDLTIEGSTVDLYVGTAKYTCAVADGVITLPQLAGLNAGSYQYVTIFANNKAYTAKVDVCTTLLEVGSSNTDALKTISDEYVVLTEDVSLGDMDSFANSSTFTGVFDGCGYQLGINRARSSNSAFNICNGTIKNFWTATGLTDPGGVLVKDAEDGLVVMNAFVVSGNMRTDSSEIGLIRGLATGQTAIIEDVTVYYNDIRTSAATTLANYAASGDGTVKLNNCNFFSYKNWVSKVANNIAEGSTYTVHTSASTLFESIFITPANSVFVETAYTTLGYTPSASGASAVGSAGGNSALGEYITFATSKSVDTSTWLYQDNFTNLATSTSTWYLVGDIDMSKITWTAPSCTSIVLDGCGNSISNLTSQLFANTTGGSATISNIAFLNDSSTNTFVSDANGFTLTVENAYFHRVGVHADFAGVTGHHRGGARTITFKNCFVLSEQTGSSANDRSTAFVGRCETGTFIFDNCYVVSANLDALSPAVIYWGSGANYTITGTKDTDYFTFDSIATLLTEAQTNANIDLTASMLAKYAK